MTDSPIRGAWITAPELADLPVYSVFHRQLEPLKTPNPHADIQNRHLLFRKKFLLDTPVSAATLRISADDYYKLYINGRFVAQGPAPAYPFRYFYNTLDVTPLLVPGENTVAVHTYYQGLINRVWVSGDNRHGLILDLDAGGQCLLASDPSFKVHPHTAYSACGIAGYKTQFLEQYDARAPECTFFLPAFDDSAWENAALRRNPDWQLAPQPSEQLVFELISPADIRRDGRTLLVDFGAVYVGSLALIARGTPGSEIILRFAQELNPDGTARCQLRCNCTYIESMILSGNADSLNQYDYKSFRYAEIVLPEGADLAVQHIRLVARHYPFRLAAKPRFHDPDALAVWDLCVNTLRYGVQEVIQDCMDREKGYYLGDGCYSLLTTCILQNDFRLFEKFIDDALDTAFVNPGLMTCADCAFMQEIAEYPLIMLTVLLPYLTLTGNRDFIRNRWAAFTGILDFYRDRYADDDGLLNHLDKWCVVEWPRNFRDGYDADIEEGKVCTVRHNVINAYYIGAVRVLNRLARRVGLPPCRTDEDDLRNAFIRVFYDPEAHLFRDSDISAHHSLPGNVFAAFYGLLPDDDCRRNLLAMVREKRLTRANLFVPFPLLAWLRCQGEEDLVHRLLTDPDAWLRMLAEGATRTFEGWSKDAKWNTSLFHLTLSFAAAFLTDWPVRDAFDFSRNED